MTQELAQVQPTPEAVPLGKAEYFVELRTPYRWSSGPLILDRNPHGDGLPFASLAEAAAYAQQEHNPSRGEDSVEASYGVRYVTKLDSRAPGALRQQEV